MNVINSEDSTALMEAASWDHVDCVQRLLDAGADVNFATAFHANHRCVGETVIKRS